MRAKKVDQNHAEIVHALRSAGASVQTLASVGNGVPDLLVGFRGMNLLMECKDGTKPPSHRKLTQDQELWLQAWRGGQVWLVTSVDEALDVIIQKQG